MDKERDGRILESSAERARESEPLFEAPPEGSEIIIGDSRSVLKKLPEATFRCCVTSPPYWGLRDYGQEGQVGAESRLDDYIASLNEILRQVRRVLTPDGTLWLNLGDSYTSGNRTWRDADRKNPARAMSYRPPTPDGLKPKDLIGVPWRVAFSLQADGWYLRSDIIWHKPNCQPESVKDRPTNAHEYIFLFSKSEKYFYDYKGVREPAMTKSGYRNCRTVWRIKTEPSEGGHLATFPRRLVEPCILAGSQAGDWIIDPFFGSGTVGMVAVSLHRRFVGIEIKPEYAELARKRLGWRRGAYETVK